MLQEICQVLQYLTKLKCFITSGDCEGLKKEVCECEWLHSVV